MNPVTSQNAAISSGIDFMRTTPSAGALRAHRVENPLGLLRTLRGTLETRGRVLVETHGCDEEHASPSLHVFQDGDVYARDDFIYWGFTPESLRRLGALAGFASFDLIDSPVIDGHPRLIGVLNCGEDTDS